MQSRVAVVFLTFVSSILTASCGSSSTDYDRSVADNQFASADVLGRWYSATKSSDGAWHTYISEHNDNGTFSVSFRPYDEAGALQESFTLYGDWRVKNGTFRTQIKSVSYDEGVTLESTDGSHAYHIEEATEGFLLYSSLLNGVRYPNIRVSEEFAFPDPDLELLQETWAGRSSR